MIDMKFLFKPCVIFEKTVSSFNTIFSAFIHFKECFTTLHMTWVVPSSYMHKAVQYRIEAFESYTLYLQKQFRAAEDLFAVSRGALRKLFPRGKFSVPPYNMHITRWMCKDNDVLSICTYTYYSSIYREISKGHSSHKFQEIKISW